MGVINSIEQNSQSDIKVIRTSDILKQQKKIENDKIHNERLNKQLISQYFKERENNEQMSEFYKILYGPTKAEKQVGHLFEKRLNGEYFTPIDFKLLKFIESRSGGDDYDYYTKDYTHHFAIPFSIVENNARIEFTEPDIPNTCYKTFVISCNYKWFENYRRNFKRDKYMSVNEYLSYLFNHIMSKNTLNELVEKKCFKYNSCDDYFVSLLNQNDINEVIDKIKNNLINDLDTNEITITSSCDENCSYEKINEMNNDDLKYVPIINFTITLRLIDKNEII